MVYVRHRVLIILTADTIYYVIFYAIAYVYGDP